MRFLKIIAGVLAAVMFMLSAVSGTGLADDIIITDEDVDPVTGLKFTLLEDGTYSVECPIENRDKLVGDIVVPSEYNGVPVTELGGYGFFYCENITSVELPESITRIASFDAFAQCTNLKEIFIPKSVERINGIFYLSNCCNLENIYVAEDNEFFSSIDGVLLSKDKTVLFNYPTGRTDRHYIIPNSVTTISQHAFLTCNNLTDVTIPESVVQIEPGAFNFCDNLETLYIPASVTNIGRDAVSVCNALKSIDVDDQNPNYCSVDGILFSKDMTQLVKYPEAKPDETYVFPDGVTDMMGIKNDFIKTLIIPEGVKSIQTNGTLTGDDNYNFHDCSIEGNNLETLILPKSLEQFDSARTSCDYAEIRYGGTVAEWKKLTENSTNKKYNAAFTIICSDGVIEGNNLHVITREPVAEEDKNGSVSFTAGISQETADTVNSLLSDEVREIKSVIENVFVNAPTNSGFDTSIQFYVVPNVPVTQDFGDKKFTIDLIFKNSDGERVQPQSPVTVKIPVPERLKDSSPIYVYHIGDDGKSEKVAAETMDIDGVRYVVFKTSSFSVYVLTDKDNDNTGSGGNASGSTSSGSDTSKPTESDTSEPTGSDTSEPDDTSEPTSDNTSESDNTSGTTSDDTSKPDNSDPETPPVSDDGEFGEDVVSESGDVSAEIVTPLGSLMNAVLTDEELEMLENGVDISVVLNINIADNSVPVLDKRVANEALYSSGYIAGLYLDVKLFKSIGNTQTRLDTINEPITLSFEIPETLRKAGRKYVAARVHNGVADILDDYDDDASTITIRTDKFSTYVLAYSDNSANIDGSHTDVNNPYTSGESHTLTYLVIGMISLVVFVTLCLFTGKNGMSEEEKERRFSKIIAWGKRGGKVRAAIALAVIFLLLSFYYGIGMKTSEN